MFSILSLFIKVSVHVLAWDLPFNEKSLNFEILSHFEDEYNNVQNFRYNDGHSSILTFPLLFLINTIKYCRNMMFN